MGASDLQSDSDLDSNRNSCDVLLVKGNFTIKDIQHSRSEYIFLVPALGSARNDPFGKNKVNQKKAKNLRHLKNNDKFKVHYTWQGPPSRLFSQPECLVV